MGSLCRYVIFFLTVFIFTVLAPDSAFSQPIVFQEDFDDSSSLDGWSQTVCIKNDPEHQVCGMGTFSRLLDPKGPPTPLSAPSSPPNWGFVQISNPISNPLSGVEVRYQKSFNVVTEDDYPINAVLGTKDCEGCSIHTQLYIDGSTVFEEVGINTKSNTAPHPLKVPRSTIIHMDPGIHHIELGMQTVSAVSGTLRASFDDIKIGVDPDDDGDGYSIIDDCDDSNNVIFPGATEINDGMDNNCNGIVDEGFSPSGSYYDATDNTMKTCQLGTYQPNPNQTSCIDAPVGTYVEVIGAIDATPCQVGYYQPSTGQTQCIEAEPGHYVPTTGSDFQLECQAGQYQDKSGQTQCIEAPAGMFVDINGATYATQCNPGTYQPLSSQASCLLADAGFFADSFGSTSQSQCPAGTTSEAGATSCTAPPMTDLFCNDMTIEQLIASDSYNVIDNRDGHLGDNVKGTKMNDLILMSDTGNTVSARQGDDCIIGGAGNDRIHGDKGNDQIFGGAGNDNIQGQQGDDIISGGDGNDRIHGGRGNDVITGNAGSDLIHGGQGNDTINGGDGNDRIHGGQGNDTINGGNDIDRCNDSHGNDVVTNCNINDRQMKDEDDDPEEEDNSDDHNSNGYYNKKFDEKKDSHKVNTGKEKHSKNKK